MDSSNQDLIFLSDPEVTDKFGDSFVMFVKRYSSIKCRVEVFPWYLVQTLANTHNKTYHITCKEGMKNCQKIVFPLVTLE